MDIPERTAEIRALLAGLNEDERTRVLAEATAGEHSEKNPFSHAQFARHLDGRIAARFFPDEQYQWATNSAADLFLSDAEMAGGGWRIVPETPAEG